MMLSPRMQKLLVYLEKNGNVCTMNSQPIFREPHRFYSEINAICNLTSVSGHPAWIRKVAQPDRTFVYSLYPVGSIVAKALVRLHEECKL